MFLRPDCERHWSCEGHHQFMLGPTGRTEGVSQNWDIDCYSLRGWNPNSSLARLAINWGIKYYLGDDVSTRIVVDIITLGDPGVANRDEALISGQQDIFGWQFTSQNREFPWAFTGLLSQLQDRSNSSPPTGQKYISTAGHSARIEVHLGDAIDFQHEVFFPHQ